MREREREPGRKEKERKEKRRGAGAVVLDMADLVLAGDAMEWSKGVGEAGPRAAGGPRRQGSFRSGAHLPIAFGGGTGEVDRVGCWLAVAVRGAGWMDGSTESR